MLTISIIIYVFTGLYFIVALGGLVYILNNPKIQSEYGLSSLIYLIKNQTRKFYYVRAVVGTVPYLFFTSVAWLAKLLQLLKTNLYLSRKYGTRKRNAYSSLLGNPERDLILLFPFVVLLYGYLILNGFAFISINYLVLAAIYAYIVSYIIHSGSIIEKLKKSPANVYVAYIIIALGMGSSIIIAYSTHLIHQGISFQSIQVNFLEHATSLFTLKPIEENLDTIDSVTDFRDYIFTGCGYLYVAFIFKSLFQVKEYRRQTQDYLAVASSYLSVRDLKNAEKWLSLVKVQERNNAYWTRMVVFNALSLNKDLALQCIDLAWGGKTATLRNIDLRYLTLFINLAKYNPNRQTILIYLSDWASKSKHHLVFIYGLMMINRDLKLHKETEIKLTDIIEKNNFSDIYNKMEVIGILYAYFDLDKFEEIQTKGHFENFTKEMIKYQAYMYLHKKSEETLNDGDKLKFNYIISQLAVISRKVSNEYEIETIYAVVKFLRSKVRSIDPFMEEPLEVLENDLRRKIPKSVLDEKFL